MEWENVGETDVLQVFKITDNLILEKTNVTKREFEGIREKFQIVRIYHLAGKKDIDLREVCRSFSNDWEWSNTRERLYQYQIQTIKELSKMVSLTNNALGTTCFEIADERKSDWLINSLDLLGGLLKQFSILSGGDVDVNF